MPRFKPSKPGGSTTDPTRYRPPSIAELKELRRNALAYMGIKGGLSQFDAAMVMGRPRRWWEGMELRKSAAAHVLLRLGAALDLLARRRPSGIQQSFVRRRQKKTVFASSLYSRNQNARYKKH